VEARSLHDRPRSSAVAGAQSERDGHMTKHAFGVGSIGTFLRAVKRVRAERLEGSYASVNSRGRMIT